MWMRETSARLCLEFVTDFVFYCVFWNLLLIFCSSGSYTALHYAAGHGRIEACKLLIAAKTDVNAADLCASVLKIRFWFFVAFVFWNLLLILCFSEQCTALHYAAQNGQMKPCQLLIAAKADVDATDECALMFNFVLLILRCIILMFATHPPACRNGKTPLKYAIDRNKHDVVALLRSVGASQ